MRSEPRVNAIRMEIVVTVRKRTAFISVDELRQADGAVVESTACGGGRVSEGRKGFENGRIKFLFVESGGKRALTATVMVTVAKVNVSAKKNDDEYEYEEKNGRGYQDFAVTSILSCKVWVLV